MKVKAKRQRADTFKVNELSNLLAETLNDYGIPMEGKQTDEMQKTDAKCSSDKSQKSPDFSHIPSPQSRGNIMACNWLQEILKIQAQGDFPGVIKQETNGSTTLVNTSNISISSWKRKCQEACRDNGPTTLVNTSNTGISSRKRKCQEPFRISGLALPPTCCSESEEEEKENCFKSPSRESRESSDSERGDGKHSAAKTLRLSCDVKSEVDNKSLSGVTGDDVSLSDRCLADEKDDNEFDMSHIAEATCVESFLSDIPLQNAKLERSVSPSNDTHGLIEDTEINLTENPPAIETSQNLQNPTPDSHNSNSNDSYTTRLNKLLESCWSGYQPQPFPLVNENELEQRPISERWCYKQSPTDECYDTGYPNNVLASNRGNDCLSGHRGSLVVQQSFDDEDYLQEMESVSSITPSKLELSDDSESDEVDIPSYIGCGEYLFDHFLMEKIDETDAPICLTINKPKTKDDKMKDSLERSTNIFVSSIVDCTKPLQHILIRGNNYQQPQTEKIPLMPSYCPDASGHVIFTRVGQCIYRYNMALFKKMLKNNGNESAKTNLHFKQYLAFN